MYSALEMLPVELVDHVTAYLEMKDVCAVRQTSRTMCAKINVASFEPRFFDKTIALTRDSLESLIAVTQPNRLGRELQRLTITSPRFCDPDTRQTCGYRPRACNPPQKLQEKSFRAVAAIVGMQNELRTFQEQEQIRLLSEAFNNIKCNSRTGTLEKLLFKSTSIGFDDIHVTVVLNGRKLSCDEEQDGMDHVFRVVMISLANTGLMVTSLFGIARPETSVSIGELPVLTPTQGLAESLRWLKNMKIGLSFNWTSLEHYLHDKALPYRKQVVEAVYSETERYISNLTAWLRLTPALETLSIHVPGQKDGYFFPPRRDIRNQVFRGVIAAGPFPMLNLLVFRDFQWEQIDMDAFKCAAPGCEVLT